MNKTVKYTEPFTVGWADVILSYDENEARDYDTSHANGIRGAISRTIKYEHPDMEFTTWFEINKKGERRFMVRRLSKKEIKQQQSAGRAG